MTDLMDRKSKQLVDLVRMRVRYRDRLIAQLSRHLPGKHQAYVTARLDDVNHDLAEIRSLLEHLEQS